MEKKKKIFKMLYYNLFKAVVQCSFNYIYIELWKSLFFFFLIFRNRYNYFYCPKLSLSPFLPQKYGLLNNQRRWILLQVSPVQRYWWPTQLHFSNLVQNYRNYKIIAITKLYQLYNNCLLRSKQEFTGKFKKKCQEHNVDTAKETVYK